MRTDRWLLSDDRLDSRSARFIVERVVEQLERAAAPRHHPHPNVHMLQPSWPSLARRAAALALLPLAFAACEDPNGGAITAPNDDAAAARAKKVTPPGAPTEARATAGDAQATVTWTAPKKNGGAAITSYRVTSNPDAKTATVSAPSTTATVTELRNGTSYTFTVVATNSAGDGAASSPSNAVVPTGSTTSPPPPPPPGARWVSGYYVGYQRDLYPVETVDFTNLTHLFVGRIIPATDGSVITHFDIDNVNGPAMAKRLAVRAREAGRMAVLMLGGAGERAGFVGAASNANRAKFVANLLATMDDLGYDGIDVDWEPVEEVDKAPLLALLQELRAARPNMILTMPVSWVNPNWQTVDPFYVQVANVVDQMNIMSYYMAGTWGGWLSWHSSALAGAGGQYPSSVSGSAQLYVDAGVPRAKLGIGLGFFGMCWRGVDGPRQSGGWVVAADNVMSYRNIMASYYTANARRWDDAARVPYLSFTSQTGPAGCTFVSYDDEQSIAEKGAYVKNNGLGGAIVWTIAQGHLPTATEKNPLLKAAYESIVP